VAVYRRYVTLARAHWGEDDHGLERVRQFVRWHLDFWCREARQHEDGSFPTMQMREPDIRARSPLEALLGRCDGAGLDFLAARLTRQDEIVPEDAPPPADSAERELVEAEG
jgi:hypothetical protein